jgi:hypothetical protein
MPVGRTQLLLPAEPHRRATGPTRARRLSPGSLVREALVEHVAAPAGRP